jgi:uncharacterized OB-fold protein
MPDLPALPYPPRLTAVTRPFYKALADGRLLSTRCRNCRHLTFPPKGICPRCWRHAVEFEELAPTGVLRSFTEIHAAPARFAAQAPYLLGIVDLDAGVRCAARVLGRFEEHACDERVELCPQPATPVPLFAFRRIDDDAGTT